MPTLRENIMQGLLVSQWTTFDQLALVEVPRPQLGARDVRIRIQAAGVSFATSLVVQGKYQRKPPLPFTPGTEVAGIIVETGAEARRFKVGDRVCAVLDWGGLAEEAVAREVNVFAIPDTLSFARAIAFTNSYATSAAALTWPHLLNVRPARPCWCMARAAASASRRSR
jgi:NADPH2:quinone reductase